MLHPRAQAFSVHTVDGRRVADLSDRAVLSSMWSRELSEVSRCELTVATGDADGVHPWHHWITGWDGDTPVWTGPVQRVVIGRDRTTITARDVSTLMWRTRTPLTKRWQGTEVARIAAELWARMLELHRVNAEPVVNRVLSTAAFDVSADADKTMMHQVHDELVKLGLQWTVVAGRPILGPVSTKPVGTLGEADLVADIEVVRDGTNTYNDVRLQGQNFAAYALADLGGLRLQTLVSLDTVFGVSNVQNATNAYAAQVSQIRDALVIPAGASLRLDQPFGLDALVPGAMFSVYARGLSALMRLEQVEVRRTPSTYDVAVTLAAHDPVTELGRR